MQVRRQASLFGFVIMNSSLIQQVLPLRFAARSCASAICRTPPFLFPFSGRWWFSSPWERAWGMVSVFCWMGEAARDRPKKRIAREGRDWTRCDITRGARSYIQHPSGVRGLTRAEGLCSHADPLLRSTDRTKIGKCPVCPGFAQGGGVGSCGLPLVLVFAPPPQQPPPPVPKYLLVTGDCYYKSTLTDHWIRRRTYELLDQYGKPMGNGIGVTENVSNITPSSNVISASGQFITGNDGAPSSIYDFYSNGGNLTSTSASQQYFAGGNQLTVVDPGNGYYGTQGVYYGAPASRGNVFIDGRVFNLSVNPNEATQPCDSGPTPGYF
jgi:hypothetical protein